VCPRVYLWCACAQLRTCLYTGVGLLFTGLVVAVTVAAFHAASLSQHVPGDCERRGDGVPSGVPVVCLWCACGVPVGVRLCS